MTTIDQIQGVSDEFSEGIMRIIRAAHLMHNPEKAEGAKNEVRDGVREIIDAAAKLPPVTPNGVEFGFVVFLRSDHADVNVTIRMESLSNIPDFAGPDLPVAEMIETMPSLKPLRTIANDWRVMTRPEIALYKAEQVRKAVE